MDYECDQCGAVLAPGTNFCPKCGQKFDQPVPETSPSEAPPPSYTPPPQPATTPPPSPAFAPPYQQPYSQVPLTRPVPLSQNAIFIALCCLFCFPVGLILLWVHPAWQRQTKIIGTCLIVAPFLIFVAILLASIIYSTTPQGKAAIAAQERADALRQKQEAVEEKKDAARQAHEARLAEQKQAHQAHIDAAEKARADRQAALDTAASNTKEDEHASSTTPTADERLYGIKMMAHAQEMSKCIVDFSNLCQQHDFGNNDWTLKMAASLVTMKMLAKEGKQIEAPARFTDVQNSYNDAMDDFAYIADAMPEAIDKQDADIMRTCLEKMDEANEKLHKATRGIDRFNAKSS